MRHTHFLLAAALAALAACGGTGSTSSSSPGPLSVTANPTTATADGVSTVDIHVAGSNKGPINVVASIGTFPNGSQLYTAAATPFDVPLKGCNAAVTAACAGVAQITAGDADGASGLAYVTFTAPSTTTGSGSSGSGSGSGSSGSGSGSSGSGTTGSTATYVVALSASSTTIPADGVSTATITATVTQSGSAAASRGLAFTLSGPTGAALSAASATTDANGTAFVKLTASTQAGTALITATDVASGTSGSVTIYMTQLGQVNFLSSQYPIQGVVTSGFQEVNLITFQLLDSTGNPYPANLAVTFTHESLGGSFVGPGPNCAAGSSGVICSTTGVTNAQGQAQVLLTSGRVAGVVSVTGTATAGGVTASGVAGNLAIVGAKANGAHISIDCNPKNIPALTDDDCSFTHYGIAPDDVVQCTVSLADRFNNALGVATLVTFMSEAGDVGPPVHTTAYDPTQAADEQPDMGMAVNYINVQGGTLPADVPPFAGENSYSYSNKCGTLVHNPRDGVVTVIAMANGEEGFVDVNGDGIYTPATTTTAGEPFIDMGEPYVDVNDNGQWDPGEPFVDLNSNGQYDGPNGKWDANTVIWAETRIVYTGYPIIFTTGGLGSSFIKSGMPPSAVAASPVNVNGSVTGPSSQSVEVVFTDQNYNVPAAITTYTEGTVGTGIVTTSWLSNAQAPDWLGMTYSQQYCDSPTTPTKCSNVCQGLGPNGACYVVTNVGNCTINGPNNRTNCTGFNYGTYGSILVTGACATKIGEPPPYTDWLWSTYTLNGIYNTVPYLQVNCTP